MRLIPGKTKVQVELFRGVTLADVLIILVAAILAVFVLTSSLPGKLYFLIGIIVLTGILVIRLDTEPNYVYFLHILRHFGYNRRFSRTVRESELTGKEEKTADGEAPAETAEQRKARLKAEREEYLADEKKLKDKKNLTKEEEDAIWLKRANQSAAKKLEKKAKKAEKTKDVSEIVPFTGIKDDFIEYGGEYYGAAIEIRPVEFRFFSEHRRVNSIENGVGRILRALPAEYAANIVKIERPVLYDDYLKNESKKIDDLRASYEAGSLTEEEFKARSEIVFERITELRELCFEDKVVEPAYYIVLFDSDKSQLAVSAANAIDSLRSGELNAHRLDSKELAVFLKYTNTIDFDERDVENVAPERYAEWAMPEKVSMQFRTVSVSGILTHNMRVVNYPSLVDDAWMASVMSVPSTKVVIKCRPMDRSRAVRGIDRSLQELRGQLMATGVDSKRIELQDHIETLSTLLSTLQGDNEILLDVNVYITAYDITSTRAQLGEKGRELASVLSPINGMKRVVRRIYSENNLRLNNMEFDQVNAFIGGQISAWDPLNKSGRGIPGNSVAAAYPWVFSHIADEKGVKLGTSDGIPVFIDFFRRDSERVNSNMVIVGKSGSGKSYATKSLLANLAADGAKIFILDPENEYSELAANLHGKFINVGNAQQGRLNPFHIITALDDDESEKAGVSGSYSTHLQFLEEFFRQILPDCEKDAMEYLNSIIDRMYTNMDITSETDLSLLGPEDYPTFDNLYDAILSEFQSTDNEYIRTMLRTLMNYVAKFSGGGRNANIWNGPSTVTTEENFTVFNFQSLLSNRNQTIANAQMLLVLKYIDNEIIKNRDYNTRYKTNRKVVVVIDEAHVFIDAKYPVALDFMFQLAKRIRKYNGMQIVITQNIKDFVGSEEIARKSTAIINACQYSFIFALAPNDMEDLCRLYEKAGGINESEQEQIVSAPRGQAFTVMSPQSRSTFRIEAPENVVSMFEEPDHVSRFFGKEADGLSDWDDFVGDSRALHDAAVPEEDFPIGTDVRKTGKKVTFLEMTEEEYETERREREEAEAAKQPSRPAEPVQPAANTASGAPAGDTEKMLGDLLGRFSYDTMLREIRRSVREEMEKEYAARQTGQGVRNDAADEASLPVTEERTAETEKEPVTAPAGTETKAEEEKPETFDIMTMLMAEAQNMEPVSPIELMEEYGEDVLEITLEELIRYNMNH